MASDVPCRVCKVAKKAKTKSGKPLSGMCRSCWNSYYSDRYHRVRLGVLGEECEVCSTSESLVLDHDHAGDGRTVRGTLCRTCNMGLGMFKDDPERLQAAAQYLLAKG